MGQRMDRTEAIKLVREHRGTAPVIGGPGSVSMDLYDLGYDERTIYNMELGYPTPICLGLALSTGLERVIALEGDGSITAQLGVLGTIARYRPPNLVVVVMDDGLYAGPADGRVRTITGTGTDLERVAVACGLPEGLAATFTDLEAFGDGLRTAMTAPGPWLLVCKVAAAPIRGQDAMAGRARPAHDIVECAVAFRRAIAGDAPG